MDLRQLRCFLAVAEKLNFPRAAASMHMTQSAVWRQVKNLENDLGVPVFENRKHALRLTPAGESLLADARRVMEDLQRSRERAIRAARRQKGLLQLAVTRVASSHPVLLQAISAYRALHPDIDLRILALPSMETPAAVSEGKVDGAFVVRDMCVAPGVDLLDIENFRVALVMCRQHRLATRPAVKLADLKDEAFFLFTRSANPAGYDAIMRACLDAGFAPNVIQFIDDGYLGVNLASINFALSFSFRLSPDSTHRSMLLPGNIAIRHVEDLDVRSQFSFAWSGRNASASLAGFIAILKALLESRRSAGTASAAALEPAGVLP